MSNCVTIVFHWSCFVVHFESARNIIANFMNKLVKKNQQQTETVNQYEETVKIET